MNRLRQLSTGIRFAFRLVGQTNISTFGEIRSVNTTLTPTNTRNGYRVAILNRVDGEKLRETLMARLGLNHIDAMMCSRHVPGLLKHHLSEVDAQALADDLRKIGFKVAILRNHEVSDMSSAESVHHARCEPYGLRIVDIHNRSSRVVPWAEIKMVCIGEVPTGDVHRYAANAITAVTAGRHFQPSLNESRPLVSLEAWITCRWPFCGIKINQHELNFESLGITRVESSTVNFGHFIRDVMSRCTGAYFPESTRAYIQHTNVRAYRFASASDFQEYATLQSILSYEMPATNFAELLSVHPPAREDDQ